MMKVLDRNGRVFELDRERGQRVLYALTTLAQTPVIACVLIERVEDDDGTLLWPPLEDARAG